MAGVKQLGHANIRVRDVQQSEKFYTEAWDSMLPTGEGPRSS